MKDEDKQPSSDRVNRALALVWTHDGPQLEFSLTGEPNAA